MDGLTITGNTPFEKAERARAKAHLTLVTHLAVKELVQQIDECDIMIQTWQQEVLSGTSSEVTLNLATQALKDKKIFEAALIQITLSSAKDLGLEA